MSHETGERRCGRCTSPKLSLDDEGFLVCARCGHSVWTSWVEALQTHGAPARAAFEAARGRWLRDAGEEASGEG